MSHVQEYKILTIRNANDHADLLNKARKEFNETYANNALIKAGYECFRYKELYEKERQELLLLKRKLNPYNRLVLPT